MKTHFHDATVDVNFPYLFDERIGRHQLLWAGGYVVQDLKVSWSERDFFLAAQ
jgi:hypothetical protein